MTDVASNSDTSEWIYVVNTFSNAHINFEEEKGMDRSEHNTNYDSEGKIDISINENLESINISCQIMRLVHIPGLLHTKVTVHILATI